MMAGYDFYVNAYLSGVIPPEEWDAYSARAAEQIGQYKRLYEVAVPDNLPDGEERAICAIAEALYSFDMIANGEGGPIQSASIGSVSVGYGNAAAQSIDISPKAQARELYKCACRYLDIFRGCG